MAEARVFGIVTGTPDGPRVAYLKSSAVVTPDVQEGIGEIEPTRVFRYAARCEESRCAHHDGDRCALGARIAAMLAPVTDALPSCQIRPTCRWYAEVGGEACLRCPQVVTLVPPSEARLREVARPTPEPQATGAPALAGRPAIDTPAPPP
jgi:hypothetical protein